MLSSLIEQIEGIDLAALARAGDRRVVQLPEGLFETERAQAAGRTALGEMLAERDPALRAVSRGAAWLFRGRRRRGARPHNLY